MSGQESRRDLAQEEQAMKDLIREVHKLRLHYFEVGKRFAREWWAVNMLAYPTDEQKEAQKNAKESLRFKVFDSYDDRVKEMKEGFEKRYGADRNLDQVLDSFKKSVEGLVKLKDGWSLEETMNKYFYPTKPGDRDLLNFTPYPFIEKKLEAMKNDDLSFLEGITPETSKLLRPGKGTNFSRPFQRQG